MRQSVKYMLVASFAFSLMQVCVKFLEHIPFTELVLFRSIVSLALSLVVVWRIRINPFGHNRKFLVLRGIFGVIALSLFFYTLQKLPIATAITIQYLSPVFTSLFAIWILGEPMKPRQWLFFAISFSGIIVLKGFQDGVPVKYIVAGVISAIFSGLAYNMIRKVKNTDHPVVVVLYFPLVALPLTLIASLKFWVMPQGWDWLILLLMGVFTQVAQVNMTKAWQTEEANKIASLKYIGILFALFFDFTLFGISPTWNVVAGIVLVLSGVILNMTFKGKKTATTDQSG